MAASQTQDMKPLEVSLDSLQSLPRPPAPGAGSSPSLVSQCRAGPAQPLASGGTSAGGAQLVLVRTGWPLAVSVEGGGGASGTKGSS